MPIAPAELKSILENNFSGATVEVIDTAGDQDHFDVKVVWEGFKGKPLIQQHRMVQDAVKGKNIHAISIKTAV